MGTAPPSPEYPVGDVCLNCVDAIFFGETPKYVEVTFTDVEACPGWTDEVPIGTYLLIQTENPCVWEWSTCRIRIRWTLTDVLSSLIVDRGPLMLFSDIIMDTCQTVFENAIDACGAPFVCKNGYAVVTWGPTIGPPFAYLSGKVGMSCAHCEAGLFGGTTPKYVRACVWGIVKCDPGFPGPPNGEHTLTQNPAAPCRWSRDDGINYLTWEISNVASRFQISREYIGFQYNWFKSNIALGCQWLFANDNNCAAFELGENGSVTVQW